jgi:hypothetical protein
MTFNVHLKDGTVISASGDRIIYTATDPRILAVMNGVNTALVFLADDFEYALIS